LRRWRLRSRSASKRGLEALKTGRKPTFSYKFTEPLIKLDRDNEITSFMVILCDLILTGKFYCLNFFY
ncbi:MAG: hypothetical protein ACFNPZ_06255, partial [Fusobacterium polymorphum]